MLVKRKLVEKLRELAKQFPVVSVYGPRQSGKTTLTRMAFKDYKYINLEDQSTRKLAVEDPRGFLKQNSDEKGLILDEVQNTPDLLSYIQVYVDEHKNPGFFILTGSHNLLLDQSISQSLAGRVAILTLLPFSIEEILGEAILPESEMQAMFKGFYPRVVAEGLPSTTWYGSYLNTYVERDVRQIKNVTDLSLFRNFIELCAGRIGQLMNISSLANDCGISVNTAKGWISLLESCYIAFSLRQHHKNFSKRIVKSKKFYFYDTGLASYLLDIQNKKQMANHYLRGGLFEALIISEIRKHYYNKGQRPRTYFWRDYQGREVDCIIEKADKLIAIEIKSGKTISPDYFDGLKYWNELTGFKPSNSFLVYAGDEDIEFKGYRAFGWKSVGKFLKLIDDED